MRLLLLLLVVTGCAAHEPTPCQRQCGAFYDTCMDVGGAVDNPSAMQTVGYQCGISERACLRTCGEPAP